MFFEFDQNNSGGIFTRPAHSVWIEADSADEANKLAEENGLYFNGCDDGLDCDCCGDRWYPCTGQDGKEIPVLRTNGWLKQSGVPWWIVYYKNGEVNESEEIDD